MAERPSLLNGGAGPNTLQNDGGVPEQTRGFTVQEHEVTNQPQDGGSFGAGHEDNVGPK